MMQPRVMQLIVLLVLFFLPVVSLAETHHLYVDDDAEGPGSGTPEDPYPTIYEALLPWVDYPAGDVLHIHVASGIYRENVRRAGWKDLNVDLIIEGDPVDRPVITGSDRLLVWHHFIAGVYYAPWEHDFYEGYPEYDPNNGHIHNWLYGKDPENTYRAEYLSRYESIWVDGERMLQVLYPWEMGPGKFLVRQDADRLYLLTPDWTWPTEHLVEATVREYGLNFSNMSDVTLRNLVVRHAKIGVFASKSHSLNFENCLIEENATDGITIGQMPRLSMTDCVVRDNAYNGFQPSCSYNLTLTNVELRENNWRGRIVDAGGWRVAGVKFYGVSGVELTDVTAINNYAPGIWFDRYSDNVTITNSQMLDNFGSGLYYEISPGPLTVNGCTITGNGRAMVEQPKLTMLDAGLLINSSDNIVVNNTTIVDNWLYNVKMSNTGRTAPLWEPGQTGESDPIYLTHLEFNDCTFDPDLDMYENIYIPYHMDPLYWWDFITVLPQLAGGSESQTYTVSETMLEPALSLSPNPANAASTLCYTLPKTADVTVTIHNTLGQVVQTLTRESMPRGEHQLLIDGSRLASGSYFVNVQADATHIGSRKLVFVK